MDFSQLFSLTNIWMLPVLAVITWMAGTIAHNQFGWNAKKIGLAVSGILSLAWMAWQFVPGAERPISVVVYTFGLFLVLYSMAFTSSDFAGKVAKILDRWRVAPAPTPEAPTPAVEARSAGPADGDDYAYGGTYVAPDPQKHRLSERINTW